MMFNQIKINLFWVPEQDKYLVCVGGGGGGGRGRGGILESI